MIRRLFWISFGVGLGATTAVIASRWTRKQAKRAAPATLAREAKGGLLDLTKLVTASVDEGRRADGRARARAPRDVRARRRARLDAPAVNGSDIRETFLRFFEERGHTRVRSSSLLAAPESGLLLTGAGHGAVHPVLPGAGRAALHPRDLRAEVLPRQRHRERRTHRPAPHAVRDARELLVRGLLQGGVLRVGSRARHAGVRDRPRPSVDDGVRRRRRGGRRSGRTWGSRPSGWCVAARPTTTGGRTQPAPPDRPRRSSSTADRATGPTEAPRSTRIGSARSGTTCSCSTGSTASCEVLGDLPNKNIDTGSSVERVAMVLQDKGSFFETDLFAPLLDEVQSLSGKVYGADEQHDVAIRIVGEHARATAFLVADGVQPSNEGRGYILRRMLRRVVSASRRLGVQREVFRPLVGVVVDGFGDAYPELRENRAFIEEVLSSEEDRFSATLASGDGAVRRRAGPGARRRGRGRRRVQAVRHLRLPDRADDRARGRRGHAGRRGSVPDVAAGAERPGAGGGQEGGDRAGRRRRAADDVRGLRAARGGGARSRCS